MIMDSTNFKETVFHLNSLTETWSLDNDPDLNELKVATNNLKQLIYFDDNENKNENAIVDKSFDEMNEDINNNYKDNFKNVINMSDTNDDISNETTIGNESLEYRPKVYYSVETQCNITNDKQSKYTQTESNDNNGVDNLKKHNCCIENNLKRILDLNICPALNAIINGLLLDSNHENKTEENVQQISESIFVNQNDSGIENISNAKDISKENLQMEKSTSQNIQNASKLNDVCTNKKYNDFEDNNDYQFQMNQNNSKTNLNNNYGSKAMQVDIECKSEQDQEENRLQEYKFKKEAQLQNHHDDWTNTSLDNNHQEVQKGIESNKDDQKEYQSQKKQDETKANIDDNYQSSASKIVQQKTKSPKLTTTIEVLIDDAPSIKLQNQFDLENYLSNSSDRKPIVKPKAKRKHFSLFDSSSSVESVRNITSNDKIDAIPISSSESESESDNLKMQKRRRVTNLEKSNYLIDNTEKVKEKPARISRRGSKVIKTEPQNKENTIVESSLNKSRRIRNKKEEIPEQIKSKLESTGQNKTTRKSVIPIPDNFMEKQPKEVKRSSRVRLSLTKKYIVLCSGLSPAQTKLLSNASISIGFTFVKEWSPEVTHLVVNYHKDTNKKDQLTMRSIKYLMALLGNTWIISFDWITTSINAGKLVDEQKYEIRGVKNCQILDCPKRSRLSKISFFEDYAVKFVGQFKNISEFASVKHLVIIGNGILLDEEFDLNNNLDKTIKYIVVTESVTLFETQDSVKFVSLQQFLNAITNLEKL